MDRKGISLAKSMETSSHATGASANIVTNRGQNVREPGNGFPRGNFSGSGLPRALDCRQMLPTVIEEKHLAALDRPFTG